MQPRFRNRRRVKAALERKTRFLRCVIKRAHDEVFAVMSLRTPREFVVLGSEALHDFRPWDVGVQLRIERCCENETSER